jgi:hypothetical protein
MSALQKQLQDAQGSLARGAGGSADLQKQIQMLETEKSALQLAVDMAKDQAPKDAAASQEARKATTEEEAQGGAGTRGEETEEQKQSNRLKTINEKKWQLQQAVGTGVQNVVLISTETPRVPRRYVHREEVFAVLTGLLRNQPTLPNSSLRNVKKSLAVMKGEVKAKYRNIPNVLIEDDFRALDAAYILFGIYNYGATPRSMAFESHSSLIGEYSKYP